MNNNVKSVVKRNFLDTNIRLKKWDDIKKYYEELLSRKPECQEEEYKWLLNRSELDAFCSEDFAWRYINFTRNTQDPEIKKHYQYFVNKIQPKIMSYDHSLNKKLLDFSIVQEPKEVRFEILKKLLEKDTLLFREENIPLFTEISNLAEKFSTISSKMTVTIDGEELTLQQASNFLENTNRDFRKIVFDKIIERRMKDSPKLDKLYNQLIQLRHQTALNAGKKNFRDYMFQARGRFDYTIEDNLKLHDAIRDEIVPLLKEYHQNRKKQMSLSALKPFDLNVDPTGSPPLLPFKNPKDLIRKSIDCFHNVDEKLGEYLNIMNKKGLLDVGSRIGKAPGGYNYPLDESGMPFIFMNASGKLQDVVTMNHEGGHATHSFLCRDMDLLYFKHTPSEVAELASMSMELIAMSQWQSYFPDEKNLNRARMKHLNDIIEALPWIAIIDKFQHWVYSNPEHSKEERKNQWTKIYDEFDSGIVDWSDYEDYKKVIWQKQGHLYDVPFYYIEYAISQLGAIAIYKNFTRNKNKTLKEYFQALELGYSKSIPHIYQSAGICFDFSSKYIRELASFLKNEIDILKNKQKI